MTLNISILTQNYIICASDRRLTLHDGTIVSERSMKMTVFECYDAKGFIIYNGIGRDQKGKTPSDWIVEDSDICGLRLDQFVNRVKEIGDRQLNALPGNYADKRHTFIIAALLKLANLVQIPVLHCVSNYETLGSDEVSILPRPNLQIKFLGPPASDPLMPCRCIIATGATQNTSKRKFQKIVSELKNDASKKRMMALAIKFIKDASFAKERRGSIGSTVDIGFLDKNGSVELDSETVGGTKLWESANVITPGFKVANCYIEAGSASSGFRDYDPIKK